MARPAPRFHNFVGQKSLLDPLRRQLSGAMSRGEAMLHLMITGPSGVGKTQLAMALAEESGTQLKRIMGSTTPARLVKKLLSVQHGDFFFVDEAHALKPSEQELFFDVIDRGRVRIPCLTPKKGKPTKATTGGKVENKTRIRKLPSFTVILATDRPGQLLNALKKRIPEQIHLCPYALSEMKEIVAIIAVQLEVLLSPQASKQLGRICQGIPRRAKHLLQRLRLFFPKDHPQLSLRDVREFMRVQHIDKRGLGQMEHAYLHFLAETGKASLETLAQFLNTDRDEVLLQIEPPLVRMRLVAIDSGGRRLTPNGEAWVDSRKSQNKSKKRGA